MVSIHFTQRLFPIQAEGLLGAKAIIEGRDRHARYAPSQSENNPESDQWASVEIRPRKSPQHGYSKPEQRA